MALGRSKIEVENRCPLCKKGRIVTDPDSLEDICDNCGFVVSTRAETLEPEWREFEAVPRRKRAGPPISLAKTNMGLSTIVGRTYKKKGERTVAELRRIERLRKLQRGMLYYKSRQRSFGKAMRLLSKLTDKMNLPKSVSEEASYIYRKALESKLIKGRTIPAMVCASIYGACRNLQVPKTLEDVSNACGIGKERIARNYRVLVEQLGLEAEPIDPAKALSGIVAKLFVSEKASRKALEMIRKAQEVSIAVGKHPASLAAAAIYVACIATGERRTQKEVARAADVSEVTLRKRSKELGKLINRT